jgi:uncharacterized protein YkwD
MFRRLVHPRIVCLGLSLTLASLVAAGLSPSRVAEGQQRPQSTSTSRVAERIVELTNELRRRHGLQPVTANRELTVAAEQFALYMARHDRYSHTADGRQPTERARQHGYDPCLILENISLQQVPAEFSAEQLAKGFIQGWIDSPAHRRNMLDPDALDLGVGVAWSRETGRQYAVQKFGRHQDRQTEFSITNRTDGTVRYTVSGETYSLPPGVAMFHRQCRPAEFTIERPRKLKGATYAPRTGESNSVGKDQAGRLSVRVN